MERRDGAEWRRLFEERGESGVSQRSFYRDKGLSYSTFRSWRQKVSDRQRAGAHELAKLSAAVGQEVGPSSSRGVRVRAHDRVVIESPIGVDLGLLEKVLRLAVQL